MNLTIIFTLSLEYFVMATNMNVHNSTASKNNSCIGDLGFSSMNYLLNIPENMISKREDFSIVAKALNNILILESFDKILFLKALVQATEFNVDKLGIKSSDETKMDPISSVIYKFFKYLRVIHIDNKYYLLHKTNILQCILSIKLIDLSDLYNYSLTKITELSIMNDSIPINTSSMNNSDNTGNFNFEALVGDTKNLILLFNFDVSKAQKTKLIECISNIIKNYVDPVVNKKTIYALFPYLNSFRFMLALLELEMTIADIDTNDVSIDHKKPLSNDKINSIDYKVCILIVETFLFFTQNNSELLEKIKEHITYDNAKFLSETSIIFYLGYKVLFTMNKDTLYDMVESFILKDTDTIPVKNAFSYTVKLENFINIINKIIINKWNQGSKSETEWKALKIKVEEKLALTNAKYNIVKKQYSPLFNINDEKKLDFKPCKVNTIYLKNNPDNIDKEPITVSDKIDKNNLPIDSNKKQTDVSKSNKIETSILTALILIVIFGLFLFLYKFYYN